MSERPPLLVVVDPKSAPSPDDPGYTDWLASVTISPEGVDRALIVEHLDRTPEERLAILERVVNDLLDLRHGRWPEIR